ncbi:MAG: hypothetical protein K0U10_01575 [Gammaproteobacteria bacterium]|nr:hypothetical protein [Gammaproteobacteria bacterium]
MPELEKKDENPVTYREMMDEFRRVDDGYSSYNSYRHHKSIDVWVRDATAAQKTRPTQGAGIKIKNNRILMRCLSRLRAVDYAISHASDLNETERETIRALIKTKFDKFQSDKSHVVQKEQAFNTFLIEQLHAANLTEGCFDAAAAGALLKHYEILSHVLDAAMPIVTFEYDEQTKNLEREIQYPVTWKTGEQKKELEKLKIIKFTISAIAHCELYFQKV